MGSRRTRANTLVSAGEVALLIVCASGALSKLQDPLPAFEVAEAVTRSPWGAAFVVGLALALETGLAAALALRVLRGRRALLAGFGMLAVFTLWLALVRARLGGHADCGCFGAPALGRSVTAALIANGVVLAALTVPVVAPWSLRNRTRPASP
ncbi:MAG: MauE/DoxX family redox-associated membrane protein [Planctomycetaceae bacterium]